MTTALKDFKKPYRAKKKESIFKKRFFWIVILILIIFSGLFYFIVFSPIFQIREVKISNGQDFLLQDIQNKIQKQVEQRILFFSSRSIFLINLNQINQSILKEFPQVAEINLKRRFPNVLKVKIIERKPIAVFYQNQEYFFIDKRGIVFEKPLKNELEMLKIKGSEQQRKLKLGELAVKEEIIIKILKIKEKLKKNLEISSKQISIISDERLDVKTDEGWEIYFNLKDSIPQQIFNLEIVLEKEIPIDKRKNLEYIDLRFGNRIFFRYQD